MLFFYHWTAFKNKIGWVLINDLMSHLRFITKGVKHISNMPKVSVLPTVFALALMSSPRKTSNQTQRSITNSPSNLITQIPPRSAAPSKWCLRLHFEAEKSLGSNVDLLFLVPFFHIEVWIMKKMISMQH